MAPPPLGSRLRFRRGHRGRSAHGLDRTGAGRGPRFGSTADAEFGRQRIPITGRGRRLGARRRLLPRLCGLRWAGRSRTGRFVGGRSSERFGERGPGIVRIVIRHGRFQRRAGGGDGGTPSGNVDSRDRRIHQPARSWQALPIEPGWGRKRPRKAGLRGRGDLNVRAGATRSGPRSGRRSGRQPREAELPDHAAVVGHFEQRSVGARQATPGTASRVVHEVQPDVPGRRREVARHARPGDVD